jgi:hypothetical protein
MRSPPLRTEILVREGGLCIKSRAYPSAKADATRWQSLRFALTGMLLRRQTLREREQSLGSTDPDQTRTGIGFTNHSSGFTLVTTYQKTVIVKKYCEKNLSG